MGVETGDYVTPPTTPCWKCDGTGCENNCGRAGGCRYAYAGPDSHRICNTCHGTGWTVQADA